MSQVNSSIITPEMRASIGRQSPARPLEVLSASDVRRYVDATGDANRLWLDDEFARAAGYPGRLLPPTLVGWVPFSFRESTERANADPMDLRRQLPLPPGYTNVRNAGSETEWIAPVYLGEQLFTRSCIVDIIAREGRAGPGIYVTQEEQVLNSDEQIVLRRRHTLVIFPDKTYSDRAEEHK